MAHSKPKNKSFRANALARKARAQEKDNRQFEKETEQIIKKIKGA